MPSKSTVEAIGIKIVSVELDRRSSVGWSTRRYQHADAGHFEVLEHQGLSALGARHVAPNQADLHLPRFVMRAEANHLPVNRLSENDVAAKLAALQERHSRR